MSVIYNIGCKTCRVRLWVGQGEMIYTGEPHTMRALNEFLYKHQCNKMEGTVDHELVFGPEWAFEYWGSDEDNPWEEIDADKYKVEA
jgi:hypothetical protein